MVNTYIRWLVFPRGLLLLLLLRPPRPTAGAFSACVMMVHRAGFDDIDDCGDMTPAARCDGAFWCKVSRLRFFVFMAKIVYIYIKYYNEKVRVCRGPSRERVLQFSWGGRGAVGERSAPCMQ